MPANRPAVSRERKREQLLNAAATLFATDAFEAVSIGRIAERAGVTPNTVYWYFADKDDVLVAVADRFLQSLLTEHDANLAGRPIADQLMWIIEKLRPVRHVVVGVHARAATSTIVRTWHDSFHRTVEALIEHQLARPVATEQRAALAATVTFALEGAVLHDAAPHLTQQMCSMLAARLTSDDGSC